MNCEATPFLSMNGRAAEAIGFYERHLQAKVVFLATYEDMKKWDPSTIVKEWQEHLIAHSVLEVGASKIMIAEDTMVPDSEYVVGNHISLCVSSMDKKEIEEAYASLIGDPRTRVIVPLAKNCFSDAYGIVQDPFGVFIQLNYDETLSTL